MGLLENKHSAVGTDLLSFQNDFGRMPEAAAMLKNYHDQIAFAVRHVNEL